MVGRISVRDVTPLASWTDWGSEIGRSPSLERVWRIGDVHVWMAWHGVSVHFLLTRSRTRPTKFSKIDGILSLNLVRSVKDCYRVGYIRFRSSIRGGGLAQKLYRKIVRELGIVIMSGSVQSPHSQILWKRLCRGRQPRVYVMDRARRIVPARIQSGEIVSASGGAYDDPKRVMLFSMYKPRPTSKNP